MKFLLALILWIPLYGQEFGSNVLTVPRGFKAWVLVQDCERATRILGAKDRDQLADLRGDHWIEYQDRQRADIIQNGNECSRVVLNDGRGGWVATDLVKNTPEQDSAIRARQAAIEKQRAKRATEEKALAQLPLVDSGAASIFVGSDRKCSEQFMQALSIDGLEKRKRLADLVSFGCGFIENSNVHAIKLQTQGASCQIRMANGKHTGEYGWVPCAWVK